MAKKQTTKQTDLEHSPDPIDVHVGKRLRQLRHLVGVSQEKLAAETGITFQQVQKYELARNRISASRLQQFADILGVKAQYFFDDMQAKAHAKSWAPAAQGLSDNEQSPFSHDDVMNSKETMELIRAYYAVTDPALRKNVIKFMKQLAKNLAADEE